MSFIKIEQPDYLTRLVATTRRDDAALMAKFGPLWPGDRASTALLQVLADTWPTDPFDELNIATRAPYDKQMWAALGFLDRRVRWHGGGRALTADNERDVLCWLLTAAGREVGGLRLRRNAIGWCRVETAP